MLRFAAGDAGVVAWAIASFLHAVRENRLALFGISVHTLATTGRPGHMDIYLFHLRFLGCLLSFAENKAFADETLQSLRRMIVLRATDDANVPAPGHLLLKMAKACRNNCPARPSAPTCSRRILHTARSYSDPLPQPVLHAASPPRLDRALPPAA